MKGWITDGTTHIKLSAIEAFEPEAFRPEVRSQVFVGGGAVEINFTTDEIHKAFLNYYGMIDDGDQE